MPGVLLIFFHYMPGIKVSGDIIKDESAVSYLYNALRSGGRSYS